MPRQFEWGNQGAGSRLRHHANTSNAYLPRSLMKSPLVSGATLAQVGDTSLASLPPPRPLSHRSPYLTQLPPNNAQARLQGTHPPVVVLLGGEQLARQSEERRELARQVLGSGEALGDEQHLGNQLIVRRWT